MKTSKKIVFFLPSFSSIEATARLGLLAIANPLLRAGYEVRIIHSSLDVQGIGFKRGGVAARSVALPGASR